MTYWFKWNESTPNKSLYAHESVQAVTARSVTLAEINNYPVLKSVATVTCNGHKNYSV